MTRTPSPEEAVTDVRGKVSPARPTPASFISPMSLPRVTPSTLSRSRADEAVNKYPVALVSTSIEERLRAEGIDLVLSEEGQALLSEAGFTPAVK